MAIKDSKTKARPSRNQARESAQVTTPATSESSGKPSDPPEAFMSGALQEAIDAERAQLLQAHGLLRCLNEVLLYADGEESLHYADVAKVAARLVDESVERLDPVQLRRTVGQKNASAEEREYPDPDDFGTREIGGVREPHTAYLC